MGRLEFPDIDSGAPGCAAASETFFDLGLMYSTGETVPADLVAAHKWFNIAAARGSADAGRLRREIASEMSEREIAEAQRAARDWLARDAALTPKAAA